MHGSCSLHNNHGFQLICAEFRITGICIYTLRATVLTEDS